MLYNSSPFFNLHIFLTHFIFRVDETEEIAKPQFFGTRGPEFERICDKIEQNFFNALQDIKDVQHTILDVQASSWYDSIYRYVTFFFLLNFNELWYEDQSASCLSNFPKIPEKG